MLIRRNIDGMEVQLVAIVGFDDVRWISSPTAISVVYVDREPARL